MLNTTSTWQFSDSKKKQDPKIEALYHIYKLFKCIFSLTLPLHIPLVLVDSRVSVSASGYGSALKSVQSSLLIS
jgi:hypothetical protein